MDSVFTRINVSVRTAADFVFVFVFVFVFMFVLYLCLCLCLYLCMCMSVCASVYWLVYCIVIGFPLVIQGL